MSTLELFLFGSPRLLLDGRALETDRRKAIALLAYIAIEQQAHARETLATLLWPDYDRQSALAYLRRTLWELNNLVGEAWLVADRQTIQFNRRQGFWLDTEKFQQHLQTYRAQPDSNKGDLSHLQEAARLYSAEFLSGFTLQDSAPFEEWQRQQSASLQRDLRWALSRLVEHDAQAGQYEAALSAAHRWLALDNLDEEAHRALMRLHATAGDRSAAIRQYEHCVQQLDEELGIAPQAQTVALYEAVISGQFTAAQAAPTATVGISGPQRIDGPARQNLPNPATPFIGRRPEIEQIIDLVLQDDTRLLTLLGPGGSGKTRLAIQVASELAGQFPDGVWFVPLAPLQESESIVPAIAQALDFSIFTEQEQPRRQLINYLRGKRLLFVLDNFEHLIDAESAGLVQELLANSHHLKILVTTRTRLNISGEQLYPVAGMRAPSDGAHSAWQDLMGEIKSYSSLMLFADRAARIRSDFRIEASNVGHIVHICQLVEGMPLGIELAASWLELLTPADILSEIRRSLDFLETDVRDVPARQRSIRAVFDSSWELLEEQERETVMILSVFPGTISRQAAQEVGRASLRTLLSLVNKSWLQPTENGRYLLHELLRQFALERLRQDEAAYIQTKTAQAHYYAHLLQTLLAPLSGPAPKEALDQILLEFENIRSAWDWSVRRGEFKLLADKYAMTLFRFSDMRTVSTELISMAEKGLAKLPDDKLTIADQRRAFFTFSMLKVHGLSQLSQYNTAAEISKKIFPLLDQESDPDLLGLWFYLIVLFYGWGVDVQTSIDIITEHLPHLQQGADRSLYAFALLFYANLIHSRRQYQEAIAVYHEVLALMQSLGDLYSQAQIYLSLGSCEWSLDWKNREPSSAISHLQKGNEIFESIAATGIQQGQYYRELGELSISRGEIDQAFAYFEQEIQLHKNRGNQSLYVNSLHWASMQAVRFQDIDYARALRLQCQQALQEYDDPEQSAWSNWELGELLRVTGDFEGAKFYYREANVYFQEHQDRFGMGYFHRGSGDIALARGEFAEAKQEFEAFLALAESIPQHWAMAYATNGLGLAVLESGDLQTAEQHFLQALQIAYDIISVPDMCMLPLCGLADLLARTENYWQATALSSFVDNHDLTWREVKIRARKIKQKAMAELSAEEIQSAEAESQSWQLIEVIEGFIAK